MFTDGASVAKFLWYTFFKVCLISFLKENNLNNSNTNLISINNNHFDNDDRYSIAIAIQ